MNPSRTLTSRRTSPTTPDDQLVATLRKGVAIPWLLADAADRITRLEDEIGRLRAIGIADPEYRCHAPIAQP